MKLSLSVNPSDEDAEKDGYMYYLNDGVYGSFNTILWDHTHPQGRALLVTKTASRTGDKTYPSIIWGPTCAGADQINVSIYRVVIADSSSASSHFSAKRQHA